MQNYTYYILPLCVQKFCEYVVKISLVCDKHIYPFHEQYFLIYVIFLSKYKLTQIK
jgi:hypothetical protein